MRDETVVNFDEDESKRSFWALLRGMRGRVRFEWCAYRRRRSDRQNAYYWPCFVHPFGEYLRENSKPEFTDEMAHEVLKKMFLEESAVNRKTGAVLTFVRSTTDLDTSEFNEYLDKVAAFLATECDFRVPQPHEYHELEDEPCRI